MTKPEFYKTRRLPEPADEHWPADVAELERLVVGAGADDASRVIVGGGQHLREAAIGERRFEVVRTGHCNHILKLDRTSNLVRVEAGISWGELRDKLRDEGFSLQRYRPYPQDSTIGGLLARHHAVPPHRLAGDLREGCVAMSAVSPTLGDYRYLEAPRKASGPDLRHLFLGGEGLLGVILNVTLAIGRSFPGKLLTWEAPTAGDAAAQMRALAERGVRPAWAYWKRSEGRFCVAVHAPTKLLEAMTRRLRAQYGDHFDVGGEAELRELRGALEADMPGRRSREDAEATISLTYSLATLGEQIDALDGVAEVEITDWTPHAATAHVAFEEAPDGWSLDDFDAALAARPIVGAPSLTWPEWAQRLDARFDATRGLAVGP